MITAAGQSLLKKASRFPVIVSPDGERTGEDLSFEGLKTVFLRLVRFLNWVHISELMGRRFFHLEISEALQSDSSLLRRATNLAVHDFLIRHYPSGIFPDKRERIGYLSSFRRIAAFLRLSPEGADPVREDDLRHGLTQELNGCLDQLQTRLGLRVKSAGTNPELWGEGVILVPGDHPQLHVPAANLHIDLFPFYVFREGRYLEWRPGDEPLAYRSETGRETALREQSIRAALFDYHELFLLTSEARRLLPVENRALAAESLDALDTACSCWRAEDHAGTMEALDAQRFIQYKENPKSFEGKNLTLDCLEALCLLNLGKREEAETALNRVVRQAPQLFYPYPALMRIMEESGRTGEAARLRKKAEEILISEDDIKDDKPARNSFFRRPQPIPSASLPPELIDLKLRAAGESSAVIGRRREVAEIIEILCCMNRNNVMIVGHPGAGKTALVHEAVRRLNGGDVPVQLQQTPVYELNVTSLFAGVSHRGQLEQKLSHILSLLEQERAILFIDDIHTILNEGIARSGALDISTILKPVIEGKGVRFIAAATHEDYTKRISPIPLFSRLFQKLDLQELPLEDIVQIMRLRAEDFRRYHQVTIEIEEICRRLDTVRQFFPDRMLPDKAIALLDRVCSRKSIQGGQREGGPPHVGELDFLKMAADARGVEISTISATLQERLKELESALNRQIIGQPEVIAKLARKIVPSMTGLKMKEGRPEGVFLFVGPTGVGKTETARVLAEALLGGEEKLLRIDMSEYMEEYSVSRLIGAAPGYVGYDDQNQLIDEVRRDPYRIILLDEIEKAHPRLINIFLQVFDSGILTDARGKKAYFDKSIIILTSNVGVSLFGETRIGFDSDKDAARARRTAHSKEIKRFFRPEFLNRIDEVILFNPLSLEDARRIVRLHMDRLNERFMGNGLAIRLSDAAVELLAEKGFSSEYGRTGNIEGHPGSHPAARRGPEAETRRRFSRSVGLLPEIEG